MRCVRRVLCLLSLLLSLAAPLAAQTPVPSPIPPTTMLAWDHDGVSVDGFALYVDGVRSDLALPPRQSDGSYRAPFPALTPGTHTIEIAAYNLAGESTRASLSVRVVVIPSAPSNLRIVLP